MNVMWKRPHTIIKSGCKINLGLKILDKREDGYHNLKTIFYPLSMPDSFSDEISIEKISMRHVDFSCNIPDIDPQNNTLTKAYNLFQACCPLDFGLKIQLTKRIPHGAGLGGGSANGAEVLKYLQSQTENSLPFAVLHEMAGKIGADVPFFLYNTPCIGEGIGEKLTPINLDLSHYSLLLIMPAVHISTSWAFKKLAEQKKLLTRKKEQVNKARSEFLGYWYFQNDFEQIIFEKYQELAKTKEILLQEQAVFASLSGTGSALYAFFTHKSECMQAIVQLQKQVFFHTWKYIHFPKINEKN